MILLLIPVPRHSRQCNYLAWNPDEPQFVSFLSFFLLLRVALFCTPFELRPVMAFSLHARVKRKVQQTVPPPYTFVKSGDQQVCTTFPLLDQYSVLRSWVLLQYVTQ